MAKSKVRFRVFSAIVVGYMLAALAWWALLLIRKTNKIYELQEKAGLHSSSFEEEYIRQQYMIAGEGLVFAAALILGVILLNQAFKREMVAVKQQKNFLLSVTHELKSPITAISLILDTFKRRNLDDDKRIQLIQNGQEETHRLNKLVEDLLTAARLNPKSTLNRTSFDIVTMLDSLIEQYERNYPHFNFLKTNTRTPIFVDTNEPSLFLVVSNLLDNAVKYSNGTSQIEIKLSKKSNVVHLFVTDQGKGISDKEKKRIFDQFYRVGEEDVRTTKGTGLGLYLVKELCNKLDIKIKVRDNQPEGTIFELLIPTK